MDYSDFSSINSVETLYNFLEEKKLSHKNYCYYSSIYGIDSILGNQFFWLSSPSLVNDKNETNDENEFFLCFSATDSENIPMWYLYGGIDGKGARITLKNSLMKKFISELEQKKSVFLVQYKDENYSAIIEKTPIKYELKCSDVLYLSNYENNSPCRIKYNNHTNNSFPSEQYSKLNKKFKGAVKAVPWFYEKEFRIRISISNEDAAKVNKDCRFKIALTFSDDILSDMDIMTGPEQTEQIDISKLDGFSGFLQKKIRKSRYTGEIQMNLNKRMCRCCNYKKSEK